MKGLKTIIKESDNKIVYKIGFKEEGWKQLESGEPVEVTYPLAGSCKLVIYLRRLKGGDSSKS